MTSTNKEINQANCFASASEWMELYFASDGSGCGIESSLDYRPKVSLDEILCEDCMQEHEAGDRWKIVREKKQMETTRPEFKIDCVECGRTDIVGRLPKPGTDYVCERCKQEQAIPDKSRLEGAESVDGLLKVRRKKKTT